MTARYRRINMTQEPSDALGLDGNGRARCSFNIQVVKTPSGVFAEELIAILVAGGIASGAIFASTDSDVPDGDDPIITIIETGGAAPQEIHNEIGAYPQPSAQFIARAGDYRAARTLAYQAYDALKVIRNTTITAT